MTHQQRWDAVMMPNYGTPPLALDHGQGVHVWDVEGNEYLDFVGGIAVSALGHAHPAIVDAVTRQVAKLAHTSNLVMHEPGIALAERLVGLLGVPARVFFSNSGAEANECAIKLVRKRGNGIGRTEIVATDNSFHGRTLGALSITGNPPKRAPFEPLPGPVSFVDFGDVEAVRAAVGPQTAGVFVEPTLGEGGVVPAPAGYLAAVRAICDEAGALMVVDEVQSGIGRTGHWFASQAEGVRPDIITLAKGLGGGLPIGACLGLGDAATIFAPGDHGSTFGGNPLGCAIARTALRVLIEEKMVERSAELGAYFLSRLQSLRSTAIKEVRGKGLWIGIELHSKARPYCEALKDEGILCKETHDHVIRIGPPLVVTREELDWAFERIAKVLA